MASAMARFLYTLRDTDAAPAATNGHDRATLAHAHEFSDRTATTRSCSQDRNTHRAWRNAETTARTNKHHDRRDNCATNNTTVAETTAQPGSAGGQGILSRSATKTPTALARPACRPMGGGGRNIPIKQSLRHCAWCFPVSGAAVQQAGGHGGRTQSEYSESSPPASGFARHCTPPR